MSKPEFSPGPWEVVKITDSFTDTKGLYSIEVKESPWWLALVGAPAESDLIAKANANLISAVPDMYEACKLMIDALGKLSGGLPDKTFTEPYYKMWKAIAKAQGGEKE